MLLYDMVTLRLKLPNDKEIKIHRSRSLKSGASVFSIKA